MPFFAVLRNAAFWVGPSLLAAGSDLVVQTAVTREKYCLGQPGGFSSERQPPDAVTLRLNVALTYRNPGATPIVLPLEHQLSALIVDRELGGSVLNPDQFVERLKLRKPHGDFPTDLGYPPNPLYAVIPAGAEFSKLSEYVVLRIHGASSGSKNRPDFRGQRIDLRLELSHLDLTARLAKHLQAKWQGIGTLWTGRVLSDAIVVDVPIIPKISDCSHEYRVD